jgi:hypothetical protein
MKNRAIAGLTARYPGEWLLFEVSKTDAQTGDPLEGLLVAHSADRRAVRKRMLQCRGRHALIFTGPPLPKGMAAAL